MKNNLVFEYQGEKYLPPDEVRNADKPLVSLPDGTLLELEISKDETYPPKPVKIVDVWLAIQLEKPIKQI